MATAAETTTEIHAVSVANGRCLPVSKGGCGGSVGAVEDDEHYAEWLLRSGLCPQCQGFPAVDHHAPVGCWERADG